jgi:hypothetical protein
MGVEGRFGQSLDELGVIHRGLHNTCSIDPAKVSYGDEEVNRV